MFLAKSTIGEYPAHIVECRFRLFQEWGQLLEEV
jgi:hypothetical protein